MLDPVLLQLMVSAFPSSCDITGRTAVYRCALQLMRDNAGEFLRRISIICLEDAMLHPDMPLLVWLMCAQAKGYSMGAVAASACLQIVYQLACMPVRDRYPVKLAELSTGSSLHDAQLLLNCQGGNQNLQSCHNSWHKVCMLLQLAEAKVLCTVFSSRLQCTSVRVYSV